MGYLLKQTSSDVLAKAIREVHQGKTFFSPAMAKHVRNHYEKSTRGVGLARKAPDRFILTPEQLAKERQRELDRQQQLSCNRRIKR